MYGALIPHFDVLAISIVTALVGVQPSPASEPVGDRAAEQRATEQSAAVEGGAATPPMDGTNAPVSAATEASSSTPDVPGLGSNAERTVTAPLADPRAPAPAAPQTSPYASAAATTQSPPVATTHPHGFVGAPNPPVAGAVAKTARPVRPVRFRIDVQANGGATVITDAGYGNFASGSQLPLAGVGVRADTRLGGGRVFLGGGLGYRYGQSFGSFATVDSTLTLHEPLAFVRLAVLAVEGLDAFAQVGGGPTIVDLIFDSRYRATQRAVVGAFDGTAGFDLYLPRRWLSRKAVARVTAGLDLAVGYTYRSPLQVRPQVDLGEDALEAPSVDLGVLRLGGFAWRAGVFIRFQ